jgi:hypothetical protein
MRRKFDRREVLAALGTASPGGLLAACGGDDARISSVTTSDGATATVESKTTPSAATAELFDESAGGPGAGAPPGGGSGPTDEKTYLRGAQVTNRDGIVEFKTIYPGIYQDGLELTLSEDGDGVLGVMTFDVQRS